MDPVTFLAIAAFTAWLVAAPDRATLTATRGTLAAARSAGRAAAGVARSEWATTAPARSAAWTARKTRLRKTRKGRAALAGIWVLGAGWRATRGGWRATRAGIAAAPDGYRDGARRATDRREHHRAHGRTSRWAGQVPQPVAPTGPAAGAPGQVDAVPASTPARPSDQEPVIFACWAKDCTEPTEVPSVFCRRHQEAACNRVTTHGELPVAADQDEASGDQGAGATASAASTTTNPAGGPADGTTPTTEETAMPSIVSGLLDQLTGVASDFVDFNRSGEWESTADLRGEVDQAEELAEAATAVIEALRKWADALEEAYAGAPFHTRAMAESVAAISESAGDPAALGEVLVGLRQALDEADALGETGQALEAAGNVEAFAAQ